MDVDILSLMTEPVKVRFWAKVKVLGPDECWPWTGATRLSYGSFGIGKSVTRGAHRIVAILTSGRNLRRDEFACHHCDNPGCCNPAHIFVGSHMDNVNDMIRKRRHWTVVHHAKAMAHLRGLTAKLTLPQACEIAKSEEGTGVLARRFGVHYTSIQRIRKRKVWCGIPLLAAKEAG